MAKQQAADPPQASTEWRPARDEDLEHVSEKPIEVRFEKGNGFVYDTVVGKTKNGYYKLMKEPKGKRLSTLQVRN